MRTQRTAPGTEADNNADRGRVDVEPMEIRSPDLEGRDRSMDPESMTLEDVMDAESGRPDLPDETEDGLDALDEEVRRQAEDRTVDAPRRE